MHFLGDPPTGHQEGDQAHITLIGHLTHPKRRTHKKLLQAIETLTLPYHRVDRGEIEHFGENEEYKVLTLKDPSGVLSYIHNTILTEAEANGYTTEQPQYSKDGYSPHITINDSTPGIRDIIVDSITLVESTFTEDNKFLHAEVLHTQPIKIPRL